MNFRKLVEPVKEDGQIKTMIRFKKILENEEIAKLGSHNKLRKELVYAGALKFEKSSGPKEDKEYWGLALENLDAIGIINKDSVKRIIENMEKNKELMPKYLVQLLLNHHKFKQRKFSTIRSKFEFFSDNEIRRLLVFSGALRFSFKGEEYWGLATRNLERLGFQEGEDTAIATLKKMKREPQRMPYHLVELLLENPFYYRRTFLAICQKLGGFTDDEVKSILIEIGAIGFEDKEHREYWGLERRNKELLDKLKNNS